MFQPAFRLGNSTSAPIVGFNLTALKRLKGIADDVPWPHDPLRVRVEVHETGTFDVQQAEDDESTCGDVYIMTVNRKTGQITSKKMHEWATAHGYLPSQSYVLTPHSDNRRVYHVDPTIFIPTQYIERNTVLRDKTIKPLFTYWVCKEKSEDVVAVRANSPRNAAVHVSGRTDLAYKGQLHEAKGGWVYYEGTKKGDKWNVWIDVTTLPVTQE
jgi:phage pi2 protein 07